MCDNASNNDTTVSELEYLIPDSPSGSHTRIRCVCHILNLVVKVCLLMVGAGFLSYLLLGYLITVQPSEKAGQ